MKQAIYGGLLFAFLAVPPVASLLESIMIFHMHMQMPLLIIAGLLISRYFQLTFPRFFRKWNKDGLPGVLLFSIVVIYWMIPRSMDDALTFLTVEIFKFVSLTFLAGVPLRDSYGKLNAFQKNVLYIFFILVFTITGLLYVLSDGQLCNNYLLIEQKTLGWGSLAIAVCLVIYLFVDKDDYFKTDNS